jgi:hypothetical protein
MFQCPGEQGRWSESCGLKWVFSSSKISRIVGQGMLLVDVYPVSGLPSEWVVSVVSQSDTQESSQNVFAGCAHY